MKTTYNADLQAHLSVDDNKKVRVIRHSQQYWESEESIPSEVANGYLQAMAETLAIPASQLRNLTRRVSFLDPRKQDIEYHVSDETRLFDSITIGYSQTFNNVPVWRHGLSVTIKQAPSRIVAAMDNSEVGIKGTLPTTRVIDRYRQVFRVVSARQALARAGLEEEAPQVSAAAVRSILSVSPTASARSRGRGRQAKNAAAPRLLSGKFFYYKYDPARRYGGMPGPAADRKSDAESLEDHGAPFPKLPSVPARIQAGQSYLVAELVYEEDGAFGHFVWLVLIELETGAALYIEPQTHGVNGLVFARDPMVSTGNLTITSAQSDAVLNPNRADVFLNNLDGLVAGVQNLRGTFVDISAVEAPVIAAPTTNGADFDFNARTNDFAAVNAYYHETELFRTIESLGFPVATYFNGTTFPIRVDHRGMGAASGSTINAHWSPNGTGGTGHMCYALCDTTNTTNPLGRAVDPWVHWHEMGGHGTLGDFVGGGTLGFAHSAGDGLAAIQNDPDSGLRAVPERFRYAPFRPFTTERRFDRPVATWAWGSANDSGSNTTAYGAEQILATCHFRFYRSIGGDSWDAGRRRFASRAATYLILRTISTLTAGTNPSNRDPVTMLDVPGRGAQVWCDMMQAVDLLDWTSENVSGGAYNKVIRWAFEQQGSYQPPAAPVPPTAPGAPPDVDVYIDDGRGGAYPFQPVHWQNTSMWNRNDPDGLAGHQNAIDGATNNMYGKVKNRGTQTANNVTVRAYHSRPGAGLTWPGDFEEMSPVGGLPIASIGPNSSQEITVGPFEWEPNINVAGHDCVLMIASTAGDPSNVDNFTGTDTIAEWRLVPNDNNVGQRNVAVVPGGGGNEALIAALDGAVFWAGNNLMRAAAMELRVDMPRVLAAKGWQLQFVDIPNNAFKLKAGQKRRVQIKLTRGASFSADEVRGAGVQNITVTLLANGMVLGGMTYQLDPDLKQPSGGSHGGKGRDCRDAAQDLVDCLKVSGGEKVKQVCIKKVTLDIEFDGKCDC